MASCDGHLSSASGRPRRAIAPDLPNALPGSIAVSIAAIISGRRTIGPGIARRWRWAVSGPITSSVRQRRIAISIAIRALGRPIFRLFGIASTRTRVHGVRYDCEGQGGDGGRADNDTAQQAQDRAGAAMMVPASVGGRNRGRKQCRHRYCGDEDFVPAHEVTRLGFVSQ